MSARLSWSSARKRWKWAWSLCGMTACAASSTVIQPLKKSSNTPDPGRAMPKFSYVAMDSRGKETKGTLEVANQNEAIGRLKEMGYFPTKVVEAEKPKEKGKKAAAPAASAKGKKKGGMTLNFAIPGLGGKVKPKILTAF